jgi:hypothetical protein
VGPIYQWKKEPEWNQMDKKQFDGAIWWLKNQVTDRAETPEQSVAFH